jgi:hypothetical protein
MAGSLEFIKSGSASTVTTFTVTDCFTDKYDVYQLLFSKMDSTTDNNFLKLNFLDTTDTVITDSTYDMAGLRVIAASSFVEDRLTAQNGFLRVNQTSNASSHMGGLSIMVFNPYDSSSYSFITAQSSNIAGTSDNLIGTKYIGVLKNTETVTGIRLAFSDSTGNLTGTGIDNMTVKVYGVK